jgi:hypothetical protein
MYIISGPELVAAFFKATKETNGHFGTTIAMEHAFGMPRKAAAFYGADDSGLLPSPALNAKTTRPEDRIFYIIHKMVNTHLSGPSLTPITARFQENLAKKVSQPSDIGYDWVKIPNLYSFLQGQVLEAAVRSIMGDYILSLNPTFIADFWAYDRGMRKLFLRTPRWWDPAIYRARDKMLENVMRWHKYAHEHCDVWNVPEDVEWEPYFGSKFSRVRQTTFLKMKALDDTARAAEDVGLLWA